MRFDDLPLPSTLQQALAEKGYEECTPVQEAVIVGAHGERDLLVSAKTGSGKTVAFGLAMLPPLLDDVGRTPAAGKGTAPRALVIAPTRELAQQVGRELAWLGKPAGLTVRVVVGGTDARGEARTLAFGADVVVGTPGRMLDHLTRGALDAAAVKVVVLDEADEMLDMGFRDELEGILDRTPDTRRTLLFSATMPRETVALAERYTNDAARITAAQSMGQHEDIEHVVHLIDTADREAAVVNVLREHEAASALVFCQTREGVARLAAGLLERGFHAVAFSGELSQPERQRALQSVRDGRTRVLVCTDVAARGLDLPRVGLVIHADPPTDTAALMHRSGRTGRAGKKGTAVVLVPFHRVRQAERLFYSARIKTRPTSPPSPETIAPKDDARFLDKTATTIAQLDAEPVAGDDEVVRALRERFSAEQLARLIAYAGRAELPAPEPLERTFEVTRARQAGERRPERAPRPEAHDVTVFCVNLGRAHNADPKWLLPLLCRRGQVEKRDIGKIMIRDTETRFEVMSAAAAHFADAVQVPDPKDPRVFIRELDAGRGDGDDRRGSARRPPPPHKRAPQGPPAESPAPQARPRGDKPAQHDRPAPAPSSKRGGKPARPDDGGRAPPRRKKPT